MTYIIAKAAKRPKLVHTLRMQSQGRVVIPVRLRRQMHIEEGDILIAWVEHNQLILKPRAKVEEDTWKQFRNIKTSLATEIVTERHDHVMKRRP